MKLTGLEGSRRYWASWQLAPALRDAEIRRSNNATPEPLRKHRKQSLLGLSALAVDEAAYRIEGILLSIFWGSSRNHRRISFANPGDDQCGGNTG